MEIELASLVGVNGADVMFTRAATTLTAMGNRLICISVFPLGSISTPLFDLSSCYIKLSALFKGCTSARRQISCFILSFI